MAEATGDRIFRKLKARCNLDCRHGTIRAPSCKPVALGWNRMSCCSALRTPMPIASRRACHGRFSRAKITDRRYSPTTGLLEHSLALLLFFELGEFLFLGGFGGGLLVFLAGVSGFHGGGWFVRSGSAGTARWRFGYVLVLTTCRCRCNPKVSSTQTVRLKAGLHASEATPEPKGM